MLNFFKRTYQTRNTYKLPIDRLAAIVTSFKDNETVTDSYYDADRREGFFKGSMYYITYELHQTDGGIILETTTTCKLPFFIPQTYTNGFIQYIDAKKDKS